MTVTTTPDQPSGEFLSPQERLESPVRIGGAWSDRKSKLLDNQTRETASLGTLQRDVSDQVRRL